MSPLPRIGSRGLHDPQTNATNRDNSQVQCNERGRSTDPFFQPLSDHDRSHGMSRSMTTRSSVAIQPDESLVSSRYQDILAALSRYTSSSAGSISSASCIDPSSSAMPVCSADGLAICCIDGRRGTTTRITCSSGPKAITEPPLVFRPC